MTGRLEPTGADETDETAAHGDATLEPTAVETIEPDARAAVVLSLGVLVVAFTALAGFRGTIGALATAAVWYAAGTPYAIALGHVALLALAPAGIDSHSRSLVVIEAAFVFLLLVAVPRTASGNRVRHAAAVIGGIAVLGATAWTVWLPLEQPLWIATGAVIAVLACCGYILHRYELVVVREAGGQNATEFGTDPSEAPTRPDSPPESQSEP
ncbi:hypothetical protein [Natrialba asiatica]|uniref:DUF8163 domain-containing protein n=1 Tax=Natrialba asiatica (strain ATCC 700177 / DSM 12278 / JCM 9576 / FERM P-10747 / NBRC 102637 / 172P1) TaxID=29540 RepID=M0B8Q9_NATA1|nr:hypothetical protein [Natrialba asiatica]ELZ06004.1 hypothetical protein C481_00680 [Natrialba asiatica DSM 12278]